MEAYAQGIERMMQRLFGSLGEAGRRRYAAIEAAKLGHGGVEYIARVFGCDAKTIRPRTGRNCKGPTIWMRAGCEKRGWTQAADRGLPALLEENLLAVLPGIITAGDPMRRRDAVDQLVAAGIPRRLLAWGRPPAGASFDGCCCNVIVRPAYGGQEEERWANIPTATPSSRTSPV